MKRLQVIIVLLVTVLSIAVLGELLLRWKVWSHFHSGKGVMFIKNRELVPSPVDKAVGREPVAVRPDGFYFSPSTTFATLLAAGGKVVAEYSVRSNSMGYLSDKEYFRERYAKTPEYRIVVLGDSMTGHTTATRQWVDTLEDILNESADFRKLSGGRKIRTYNLGSPGAGFPHFARALKDKGLAFRPDLVVVNYIEGDFGRTLEGVHIMGVNAKVEAAAKTVRDIMKLHPHTVFTTMPLHNEIYPRRVKMELTDKLRLAVPEANILDMRDFMPAGFSEEAARAWYNLPWDSHISTRGGEIYARAMAGCLAKVLSGRVIAFNFVKSKHYDPAIPESFTQEKAYTLRISRDPEGLARLQHLTGKSYALTRALDFSRSLLWEVLTGRRAYLLLPPLYLKLNPTLVEIKYGDSSDDKAWLYMTCKEGPTDLTNPGCWHSFSFFVRE